jgi:peptide/nickel transport system substrate-binding protein
MRQTLKSIAFTSAVTLCFASPAISQKSPTVLRAVMQTDVKVLDPIFTGIYITRNYGYMVYDTLLALDESGKPVPEMLDNYKVSDNGLTYTFQLRSGLKWHDGAKVTPEDCIASVKRWMMNDGDGQVLATMLDKIEAVNENTFVIQMKEPTALLISALAKPSSRTPFMMPARIAATPPNQQISEYIGSGPFRLVLDKWQPGNKMVFEKFADYVPRAQPASNVAGGKKVNIDRVEWLAMPDPLQAVNALMAGEIDYIEQTPHDLLPLLKGDNSISVTNLDAIGNQILLRPNHLNPPFNNPKVREVLWYALNQSEILAATIGNKDYYRTCLAMFGCGTRLESFAGTDGKGFLAGNVEKAREMLKASGYNGETVVIMSPTDHPILSKTAPVVKQELEQVGFKVELRFLDWQTLNAARNDKTPGKWSLFPTYVAASDLIPTLAFVNMDCKTSEFGWPCEEGMKDLRLAYAKAATPEAQKIAAANIQKFAIEKSPYYFLGQFTLPSAFSNRIKDVVKGQIPVFWNMKLN